MADLLGFKLGSAVGVGHDPKISRDLNEFANDWFPYSESVATSISFEGPITRNFPVVAGGRDLSGGVLPGLIEDLYNRIYFIPQSLVLGAVSSNTNRTFLIWNAFLDLPVEIDAITPIRTDGVELTGPGEGFVFEPLALEFYNVDVSPDGPAVIDAIYRFEFDVPYQFDFTISGTRSKLWDYPINWNSGLRRRYEFRTEIIVNRSGIEQRNAYRQEPRRVHTYVSLVKNSAELALLERTLWLYQSRELGVPDWLRWTATASPVGVGATSLVLSSVPWWVVPGARVGLLNPGEALEVESVNGNEVFFTSAINNSRPAGVRFYQLMIARLQQALALPRQTLNVAELQVEFTESTGDAGRMPEVPAAPLTFAGREVMMLKNNWANRQAVVAEWEMEMVDYGAGVTYSQAATSFARRMRDWNLVGKTEDEVTLLRNWFLRARGRQREFFVPNYEDEFQLFGISAGGTSTLNIQGDLFASAYGDSPVHKTLCVKLKTGEHLFFSVVSLQAGVDPEISNSLAVIVGTLPFDIQQSMVEWAGWLYCCTFASDVWEEQWSTSQVCRITARLQTQADLSAENF